MNIGYTQSQEQKQKISAAQIQSLQLLSLDNFALQKLMEKEFLENPLLEYEPRQAPVTPKSRPQSFALADPGQEDQSLEKYILSQLTFRAYSKKELSVIAFLIRNLDDSGFFPMEEQEAAALNRTTVDTVHRLLTDLKKLEPRGIFAKDLRECLLLQLYSEGMPNPLLKVLIMDHLEALGRGDFRGVAKKLSLPVSQIREALSEISKLNPRPLNGLDTAQTDYVIPDLLLRYDDLSGQFQAALNDDWYADYHISAYYLQMVQKTEDPQLREYFQQKYLRAKFLVEGILQRRETLLAIGNYVAARQASYLLGRGEKLPLTMTEAAEALGLSVSTVSRAVKEKYVQCPSGCVPFKSLFETPAIRQSGAAVPGRDTIKSALSALIQQEDPGNPLSDAALADRLKAQGIVISRRTVAKYRESLNLPSAFNRKTI